MGVCVGVVVVLHRVCNIVHNLRPIQGSLTDITGEKKTPREAESAANRLTTDQRLASILQRLFKQQPEWHRKENVQVRYDDA